MIGRLVLFFGALLVLASVALGDGVYQRTRDGRTLVWNSNPKSGDEATWNGARDRDGYARGFGTLTWYTKEPATVQASLYARYWGNMSQGKLNGPVNVHVQRKTRNAVFVDGGRATRWSAGPASSRSELVLERSRVAAATRLTAPAAERRTPSIIEGRTAEPEPPGAGPLNRRKLESGPVTALKGPQPATSELSSSSAQATSSGGGPMIDIDDSIRILVFPPRTLRWNR